MGEQEYRQSMEEQVKRKKSLVHQMPRPAGRPPRFSTPDDLWDKFIEYCDYVDRNPWEVKSGISSIDDKGMADDGNSLKRNYLRQEVRPIQRAYTHFGFAAYAGIQCRWNDFKRIYSTKRNFKPVIDQIENVISAQQLDGALINQFNGSLVARLNGIADKTINEIVGKDGEEFKFPKLTDEDLQELKKLNGI